MDVLPNDTMRDTIDDDDRRSIHSDDSDSGSSSSTDSYDSLLEVPNSDNSSSGTPPSSPDETKPCSLSPPSSPSLSICLPPSAYPCPSSQPISLYKAPLRVRTHLFKSTAKPAPGETIQIQTPLDGDSNSFLSCPGTVWVDKMASVYSLCPLIHSKLALVRRPAGLGRTAFLRAAMRAHESYTPHDLHNLFGISPVCRLEPSTPQFTLSLDMGQAFDYSLSGSMECRIKHYMNCHLEILLNKVGDSSGLSSGDIDSLLEYDSRKTFQNIIFYLRDAVKLVILVDDFNWPLIHSLTPEDAFEAAFLLDVYVVRPIRDALDQQFVAGGILLGRPIEDEPAWVQSYKGMPCSRL